jgi:hypothetical protein
VLTATPEERGLVLKVVSIIENPPEPDVEALWVLSGHQVRALCQVHTNAQVLLHAACWRELYVLRCNGRWFIADDGHPYSWRLSLVSDRDT